MYNNMPRWIVVLFFILTAAFEWLCATRLSLLLFVCLWALFPLTFLRWEPFYSRIFFCRLPSFLFSLCGNRDGASVCLFYFTVVRAYNCERCHGEVVYVGVGSEERNGMVFVRVCLSGDDDMQLTSNLSFPWRAFRLNDGSMTALLSHLKLAVQHCIVKMSFGTSEWKRQFLMKFTVFGVLPIRAGWPLLKGNDGSTSSSGTIDRMMRRQDARPEPKQ